MKPIATTLLVVLVLAVGSVDAQEEPTLVVGDLYATWQVDLDAQIEYMKKVDEEIRAYNEEQIAAMKQFMTGMRFVFSEGKTVLKMSPDAPEEQWQTVDMKITSNEGSRWDIVTTETAEGSKPEKGLIEWSDRDHLSIHGNVEDEQSKFHLVRVPPKKE